MTTDHILMVLWYLAGLISWLYYCKFMDRSKEVTLGDIAWGLTFGGILGIITVIAVFTKAKFWNRKLF